MMKSSTIMGRKALFLAISVVALGASGAASAATATDTFNVTASVAANCTISAADLSFGSYDPISTHASADLNAQADLTVQCTNGETTTIALDEGQLGVGTASAPDRRMDDDTGGTVFLNYELYNDSGRSTEWGTGAGEVSHVGNGTAQAHTVYGSIVSGQTGAVVDSYADVVTATVTF